MALNFKISVAARNAACDGIVDLCEGGTPPAEVEVRTGAPPATPATGDSGTLLGTLVMTNPAFGAAAAGIATASAITDDSSADASGDAGHFRVKTGVAGTVIMQGTAGEAADTTDMTFDNKSIVLGGTISISAFTVDVPEQ